MRAVFDTNIYISAFIFPGSYPEFILRRAMRGDFELYISAFILNEFNTVLQHKFNLSLRETKRYSDFLESFTNEVELRIKANVIKESKEDNKILDTAEAAEADYLVTGDKRHILPLKTYKETDIVTARQFGILLNG